MSRIVVVVKNEESLKALEEALAKKARRSEPVGTEKLRRAIFKGESELLTIHACEMHRLQEEVPGLRIEYV